MNRKKAEEHLTGFLTEGLGLDLSDSNLRDTPKRVAKMYCEELLCNISKKDGDLDVVSFPNELKYDQIIMLDRIFFTSVCAHHLLPFSGRAWVLYIPFKQLLGASKATRIIEHFAARPQLQENLCQGVLNFLVKSVSPKGAMIVMRGEHGCMKCRGVRQYGGAGMTTSAVHGAFKRNLSTREEGLSLIHLSLLDSRI